jgi:hypothetical protein
MSEDDGSGAAALPPAPVKMVSTRSLRDRVRESGANWSRPMLGVLAQLAGVRLYEVRGQLMVPAEDAETLITLYLAHNPRRPKPRIKKPAVATG